MMNSYSIDTEDCVVAGADVIGSEKRMKRAKQKDAGYVYGQALASVPLRSGDAGWEMVNTDCNDAGLAPCGHDGAGLLRPII